jgi:CheY-like chemotaxis protein
VNKFLFIKNLDALHKSQPPQLYDVLCEFLTEQFDLDSILLFKFDEENKLKFLSKSLNVKKHFDKENSYFCKGCQSLLGKNKSIYFDIHSDCQISPTEMKLNEGSLLFNAGKDNFLLKIAKGIPFKDEEKNGFEDIGKFCCKLLEPYFTSANSSVITKIITEIAHELRTPSNNIIGFASLLGEDRLTPSQAEYVSTLKDSAFNHLLLINDLIEMAKVEVGNTKEVKSKVNLKSFSEEIVTHLNNKKTDVNVTLNITSSIPQNILVDAAKLRYILITLITYSLRLKEKGKINLNFLALENGKLTIRIVDSNGSLTSKQVKTFFEPFSLFGSGNIKIGGVTGLSLILSRKYLDILDGQIEIQSNVGKGNSYTITLNAQIIGGIEDKISSLPKPSSKNKVLIVEDDYATSKILNNYLTKWGYQPNIVNYASEAFKALESEDYLAILMDIALPDSSGFELLKKIRENKKFQNIPVIVCSVEAEQQKAFLMGAVEYFVKPINYSFLVEVLQNYKLKQDANILIVDDDLPTLNLIKGAIQKLKFNPIAESHSSKVYDKIKDMRLDLAIIDLDMPEINGYDLIKQIKTDNKFSKLPIIIYTGKENYQEELKKIDGLFEDLLHKNSTNIEDLSETISQMINRYDEPVVEVETKPKSDTIKILLVEDYKHSQIIVTRLLKKNNFEHIEVVENGVEAVDKVKQEKFDLILMDMQMPIMNGFEATEKIRELPEYKHTPIIALTAFAMKGDKEKCLEAGATDYIPKPIDSQEFIDKVKQYTDMKVSLSS